MVVQFERYKTVITRDFVMFAVLKTARRTISYGRRNRVAVPSILVRVPLPTRHSFGRTVTMFSGTSSGAAFAAVAAVVVAAATLPSRRCGSPTNATFHGQSLAAVHVSRERLQLMIACMTILFAEIVSGQPQHFAARQPLRTVVGPSWATNEVDAGGHSERTRRTNCGSPWCCKGGACKHT